MLEWQAAMVEVHLAECPMCPPLYAALVGVHGCLGDLGVHRDTNEVIPPEVGARIRERLTVR